MKMTLNGSRPHNRKSGISQQPLIGSSSNFKLKPKRPNQNYKLLAMKMTSMADDLKIIKREYLRNHIHLSLEYQTKIQNIVGNKDDVLWKMTSKY